MFLAFLTHLVTSEKCTIIKRSITNTLMFDCYLVSLLFDNFDSNCLGAAHKEPKI